VSSWPSGGIRRNARLGVVAFGLVAALTGCRQTASLTRQEVVVAFKDGATPADHSRVWTACQPLPGISPEPLVTKSKYPSVLRSNVRYRVDHATNYQLQQLFNCLRKDPSVTGYDTTGDDEQ
jgi:hypothetical protein